MISWLPITITIILVLAGCAGEDEVTDALIEVGGPHGEQRAVREDAMLRGAARVYCNRATAGAIHRRYRDQAAALEARERACAHERSIDARWCSRFRRGSSC